VQEVLGERVVNIESAAVDVAVVVSLDGHQRVGRLLQSIYGDNGGHDHAQLNAFARGGCLC
jgi:hypothetical protein